MRLKEIIYMHIEDGEQRVTVEFRNNEKGLHLEHFDEDLKNGHSFYFMRDCPICESDLCWSQWLFIEEPHEEDDEEEFGWWMV